MGNLLSPLLADVFMDNYIEEHVELEEKEKLWRYVDDICMITKMDEDATKSFVDSLNTLEGSIRFTSEYEIDGQLNFLDTTLTRDTLNKKIKVRWFRKTTAADRFLNYHSCHQLSIKRNIVKNMSARIMDATQDKSQQREDLNTLRNMFIKSNYPQRQIDKLIQDSLRERTNTTQPTSTTPKDSDEMKCCLSLPYAPGMEVLKRRLEKLNIKLYFSYNRKLSSLVPSHQNFQSRSVVYKIPCTCTAQYVGETKVGLGKRMKQHDALIKKNDKDAHSEIVQHHHKNRTKCRFDPSKATILDNETDWKKRKVKEAIYTQILRSINKCDIVNPAWNNIVRKNCNEIRKQVNRRVTSE